MRRGTVPAGALLAALALAAFPMAGCASRNKAVVREFPSPLARYHEGLRLLENRKLRKAKEMLERVSFDSESERREYEPLVRIALADATFYAGDQISLIDARSLYLDFVTLYGDHPLAPYAQFQTGMCSLLQVNHPSRDQTQTLEALRDLREVERRYPTSPYARVARMSVVEANANLAEHEYLVGRFYLKRKRYRAAVQRFQNVLQRFPRYPDPEKVYFSLGKALVLEENLEEGRLYLSKLIEDYPDSEYATEARRLLPERSLP